jgi:hypothetical protein
MRGASPVAACTVNHFNGEGDTYERPSGFTGCRMRTLNAVFLDDREGGINEANLMAACPVNE